MHGKFEWKEKGWEKDKKIEVLDVEGKKLKYKYHIDRTSHEI